MNDVFEHARTRVTNLFKRGLSLVLPYQPLPGGRELLNEEYSRGTWDYLHGVEELSRFSVIVGYCQYLKDRGSILEIGCGEGLLAERLDRSRYSRFLGVDISAEAIRRAIPRQDEKTSFVAVDARVYEPEALFDVVIFNECLEYFDDPLALVRRYDRFLEPGGIYIVSMFAGIDTARTKRIWRWLASAYTGRAETHVSNGRGYSWVIKVLSPPSSEA